MLNPNDAPPGYQAVVSPQHSCDGCAFLDQNLSPACQIYAEMTGSHLTCSSMYRDDRCEVIFVKTCETGIPGPLGQRIWEI